MTTDQKTPGQVLYRLIGMENLAPWADEPPSQWQFYDLVARKLIAEVGANQPAASGVPEGWQVVPIEATAEMAEAAFDQGCDMPYTTWAEMIAAAPEAPKP